MKYRFAILFSALIIIVIVLSSSSSSEPSHPCDNMVLENDDGNCIDKFEEELYDICLELVPNESDICFVQALSEVASVCNDQTIIQSDVCVFKTMQTFKDKWERQK